MIVNRQFYSEMADYLHSIGVRVPIASSNLVSGAADVYGHAGQDVMENDSYFNHPIFPLTDDGAYNVAGPAEYVTTNPLTAQRGVGAMGTTLLSMGAVASVADKPMTLAEWNEYGLNPFHSTAFIHTVAYACLNDWDALIIYNFHTSEFMDDEPDDVITNVFNCFSDPSLMSQVGILSEIFLKGLISPSKARANVVYEKADLLTSPNFGYAPYMFLPYIMNTRNLFLEDEEECGNDADICVNAGFVNSGEMTGAKHGVYYAWSPYEDVFRSKINMDRLTKAAESTEQIAPDVYLGEKNLVMCKVHELAGTGDYTSYAECIDRAMKSWQIIPENTGLVNGALVSDTGELTTDAGNAAFTVSSPFCACYSGKGKENISLGNIKITAANSRITLELIPEDAKELSDAKCFMLTAIGASGSENTTFNRGPELMPGFAFTQVNMKGKTYADTLEGTILLPAKKAVLKGLDNVGNVISIIISEPEGNGSVIRLDGTIPAVNFVLEFAE